MSFPDEQKQKTMIVFCRPTEAVSVMEKNFSTCISTRFTDNGTRYLFCAIQAGELIDINASGLLA